MDTFAGAALGFRSWRITDEHLLVSMGAGKTVWRPEGNTAYCPHGQHLAPATDCECGLYAYHSLDHCYPRRPDRIVGVVAGRGRVEVHHKGWRAEEVAIIAIADNGNHERSAQIAERYGVPLVAVNQLAAIGGKVAELVPVAERPAYFAAPFLKPASSSASGPKITRWSRLGFQVGIGLVISLIVAFQVAALTLGHQQIGLTNLFGTIDACGLGGGTVALVGATVWLLQSYRRRRWGLLTGLGTIGWVATALLVIISCNNREGRLEQPFLRTALHQAVQAEQHYDQRFGQPANSTIELRTFTQAFTQAIHQEPNITTTVTALNPTTVRLNVRYSSNVNINDYLSRSLRLANSTPAH